MSHYASLQRACDDALIAAMPEGLKRHVLRVLASGGTKRGILASVRKGGAGRKSFTYLAVEALIERERGRRN